MSSRAEKEKQRQIQDKCQMILNQLLREEDNKYCVDCDAKGPRWASWNLGIFLCIRCAGIHRNLGVHISKVKSVNLDTWNPEQVAYLQNMGNSQARAIYEANLPDNFRRPQTDSMLESFIRAKYETKKYIAKEWVPPPPPKPAFDIEEEWRREKERRRLKNKNAAATTTQPQAAVPRPQAATPPPLPKTTAVQVATAESSSVDLLGLDIPSSTPAPEQPTPATSDPFDNFLIQQTDNNKPAEQENLFQAPAAQPAEKKAAPMSKESILSLYSSATPSPMVMYPMAGYQNVAFPVAPANGLVLPPTAATNPFLAPAAPTAYHWQPPAGPTITQVQHQMAGLQMGPPPSAAAPWMAAPQAGVPQTQPDHQGTWPALSSNLWH